MLDPGEALAAEVHLYQEHSPFAQGLELSYSHTVILFTSGSFHAVLKQLSALRLQLKMKGYNDATLTSVQKFWYNIS